MVIIVFLQVAYLWLVTTILPFGEVKCCIWVDGRPDGRMEGRRTDGCVDGGCTNGWREWMDGDGWMDGWID